MKNQIIFITIYLFLITINTQFAKLISYSAMTEWWINSLILVLIYIILIFTYQKQKTLIFKIILIPACWIIHALFTIPAALVLGILKFDPNHIRTASEHRAVFIFASIPLIVYFMKNSKLFQKQLS